MRDNRYYKRPLGKGVYVTNDTQISGLCNNDLVVASSGGGKTGSIVFPQLKTLQDSSLICVDTKGRLSKMFSSELRKKGYKVLTIDFVNPQNSCAYNPLDYIRKTATGYNEQDIMKIAMALMPDTLNGHDPFWTLSARSYLEFFIAYTLCALPEEDHNIYTVCKLYRAFTQPGGEAAFIDWLEANPNSFAAARYAQIKGLSFAEKTVSSIYAFVNNAVSVFDVSELTPIFAGCQDESGPRKNVSLDISSLGRKKTVLFLNISDVDHSMDPLVNLLYTQILQTLVYDADCRPDGRLPVPVRIIFDDFAAGAPIPDFDKIISTVRSRDIWLTLCVQSLSQLESLYSKSQANCIIGNCDHILLLGTNDVDTAEFIGTRAGKEIGTILAMPRTKEYFIEGGKGAILVEKIPPYSYSEEVEMQA